MTSKFLFWNLGKKDLGTLLERAVQEHDVAFVILAECWNGPDEVLLALNRNVTRFHYHSGKAGYIEIFSVFPRACVRGIREGPRFTVRRIRLPLRQEILLVAAHMPSKLRWSNNSQAQEVINLAENIRIAEEKVQHRRTVLVGDFNMQPFEDGMTGAIGLHGVMSRSVASRESRTVQGRKYPMFYNPMWSLMGDLNQGPPGSYYYDSSQQVEHFWWMFDQVLVRPELAAKTTSESFRLLTKIGGESLIDANGRPDTAVGSDHLPLLFEIDF